MPLSYPEQRQDGRSYKVNADGTFAYTAYEFVGWYKDSGLTEKAEDISLSDGDITLYGEWRKTTKNVEYVRVNINNTLDEEGGYILFGQYPQTIKAADVTITGDTPDENGYYLGSDGAKYVKAVADPNGSGGSWWLRSPAGAVSDSAQCVQHNGAIADERVTIAYNGVVPALNLTL